MNTTPIVPGDAGSKKRLFEIGLKALEENGYTIERIPGIGKSSVRRIKKDGQSKVVSIKTTQKRYVLDNTAGRGCRRRSFHRQVAKCEIHPSAHDRWKGHAGAVRPSLRGTAGGR